MSGGAIDPSSPPAPAAAAMLRVWRVVTLVLAALWLLP